MRRYEKYKDSGIEWVGEIPEHWESIRLKYIGYLYGGLAGKSVNDFNQESNFNNKPFIPFTNICNNKVIDPYQLQYVVIEEDEQQNQVAKGDLFFMMSSENFDDVGKSSILLDDLGETYLNSFCKGFHFTNEKYYSPFINYLLLSKAYRSLVLTEANGYTRINLKIDKINDIPLKTPPTLDEQLAIANYLDRKTEEIDELIKQKVELLLLFEEEKTAIINHAVTKGINPNVKLKDSKIDWLGEIPEHWEVKRLKYLVKINEETLNEKTDEYLQIKYIDIGNVEYGKLKENPKDFYFKEAPSRARRIVKSGDTLISTVRTYLKAILFIENADENLIASTGFAVLTPSDRFIPEFLFYLLSSEIILQNITAASVGVSYPAINASEIGEMLICFPEKNEQKQIMEFIEKEKGRIEAKVEKTKTLIEQLKEYKTALISEVSTGKVKVFKD